MLTRKEILRVNYGNKEGKGVLRTGYGPKGSSILKKIMTPPHPLTNFKIQKYYQNELRFNGVYSRDNLCKKLMDGACVTNFDEYTDVGMHWIALYVENVEIIYFDSFGVEHIPKEIKRRIGHKDIKRIQEYISRMQANNLIMSGYSCIGLIDFMLAGKTLIDYTSLFFPYDSERNDNLRLSYFKIE